MEIRIIRHRLAALAGALCLGGAAAFPQQTRLLTGDKSNEYGVVYSLPVTELVVDATCRVTTRVPGPFRQYATRYLGTEATVSEPSSAVELTGVDMFTRGVAGEQKYLFQMKPGVLADVCVAESGMLLAVNTEVESPAERSLPVATDSPQVPDIDEYLQYVDADFMSSLSSAKKAQLLAQTIMEIRDSRLSLSRGTAETMPTDGRQLELMLASLEAQENALMRAFNGYEYSETQTRRISLTPDSASVGERQVIFRLSDTDGFVETDDYSGEPVYLTLTELQVPEMPLDLKGEPKTFPKNAVVYALPATASIALEYNDGPVGSPRQFDFGQLGITFGLDPKLFTDRRNPSAAVFNPATGALERITAK